MIEKLINQYGFTNDEAKLITDNYYEFVNKTGVMINIHDVVKIIQMR